MRVYGNIQTQYFYPRPPRGGRPFDKIYANAQNIFLSTPSARRATTMLFILSAGQKDFYPRPPRGGRPRSAAMRLSHSHFYPRPPRGGRPVDSTILKSLSKISIHALREEGDAKAMRQEIKAK